MDATNNIATDLFYKVRSRFTNLKLGSETGEITINPEDARFFDFDYTEEDKKIGHVSISLAEPNSMKVYFSNGITEGMDKGQKNDWYGFLKELRGFAKRRLLAFDTRDIAKDNLDKRDYAFLSQYAKPQSDNDVITKPVGENVMNESNLYGTKTQSFQKLENTKLIIKHSKKLADEFEQKPGDRSRNISALFVQNESGERFKYPFVHLAGARAMQRHVANGGLPYDEIGESIIKMSEEIAQLKSFQNYVVRNDLMNSDTNQVVERSKAQYDGLRERIAKLSKQSYYEAYKESFEAVKNPEVDNDVMEQYKEMFTVKNFKEEITDVFPVLHRLMQEDETIGYNDIVAQTNEGVMKQAQIEVEDWYNKYNEYKGTNGDDLAQGYIRATLDTGIMTDAYDENEVEAFNKMKGYEGLDGDWQDGDFEDFEDNKSGKSPITSAMFSEVGRLMSKYDLEPEDIDELAHANDPRYDKPVKDGFDKFESWVNGLGEESPIQASDEQEMKQAVTSLNELTTQELPAGSGGTNAIQSLKGIIEDPKLENDIKEYANEDSNKDVRPLIKAWMEENAPDALSEIDFGDMADGAAVGADQVEPPQEEDMSKGFNKYGLAAVHKDGKFFSIQNDKITGGPFDSIEELQKHQEELLNKESTTEASGYEGQDEPHQHEIDIDGDFDEDRGIDENDCAEMEKALEAKGIKAACEPNEMRQGGIVIHTMADRDSVLKALNASDYAAESGIMYKAGVKKYGKDGMKAIQSAAGKGASAEEIGAIKDKHNKKKDESTVAEGGNAWDIAVTTGMEIIQDCEDEKECIQRLEAEITGSKDPDESYADMIYKDYIEKIKTQGFDKVRHEIDSQEFHGDMAGDMVDLEGQETEGNEFAQKVRQMKASGAKKGTKFKTSDGQEHTLEDVAKFITSFYDKQAGTFPKGPESVATMVEKKFGEQAAHVARKMVERMAPEQEQGAEDLEELERIKSLIQF